MADEKIITSSVFEQGITEIMQDIANNLYEFEEYTEEEVANLIDLSEEEVAELTRVINDTTVALNKVYSNKKVEDLLTELEVACNQYADEKIGGLAGIHLAYVDTLPVIGEDNVIYILKSTAGGNDTLNLYNNGWISIGEFTISLSDYYTKAEVDALLNDKANANEVFSQNDVVNDMSNVSSSTVLSTAGLNVELEKKVNLDDMTTELDKKANLDDVPTDDYIKSLADGQITANSVDYVSKSVDLSLIPNMSLIKSTYFGNCVSSSENNTDDPNETTLATIRTRHTNCPTDTMDYIIFTIITDKRYGSDVSFNNKAEKKQIAIASSEYNDIYVRSRKYDSPTWTKWQRVCTTSVADVENAQVTSSIDTTVVTVNSIAYTVKNGICYVRVNNLKPLVACNETVILPNGTLPKASTSLCYANISTWSETAMSTILLQPNTNGSLDLWCNSNALNKAHYGMFSYPVAEQ